MLTTRNKYSWETNYQVDNLQKCREAEVPVAYILNQTNVETPQTEIS